MAHFSEDELRKIQIFFEQYDKQCSLEFNLSKFSAEIGRNRGSVWQKARSLGLLGGYHRSASKKHAMYEIDASGHWLHVGVKDHAGYTSDKVIKTIACVRRTIYETTMHTVLGNKCICNKCGEIWCINPHHMTIKSRAAISASCRTARLDKKKVEKIFELHRKGFSKTKIANYLGIAICSPGNVISGKTYREILHPSGMEK